MRRRTLADMQEKAKERGGVCVSTTFVDLKSKLRWRCSRGHEWEAIGSSIMRGTWCPVCFRDAHCKTLKDAQSVASEHGGYCLSSTFTTVTDPLRWLCSEGHDWLASLNSVASAGTWCRRCAGGAWHTLAELQQVAASRGGLCLAGSFEARNLPIFWQCSEGHIWIAYAQPIFAGTWCPYCAQVAKYSLAAMQQLAESRGGMCCSTAYLNGDEPMEWQCAKGHTWSARPSSIIGTRHTKGSWCPECAVEARRGVPRPLLSIHDFEEIARSRGGYCLSTEYRNGNTRLLLQCASGHQWEAVAASIRRGRWCPHCAQNAPLTIEEMASMAQALGGLCLSRTYEGTAKPLDWQCALGHTWTTAPSVIRNGSWCPVCAGSLPIGIEAIREFAALHGGKCHSAEYQNGSSIMEYECGRGHRWRAQAIGAQKGHWCRQCAGLNWSETRRQRMSQ